MSWLLLVVLLVFSVWLLAAGRWLWGGFWLVGVGAYGAVSGVVNQNRLLVVLGLVCLLLGFRRVLEGV